MAALSLIGATIVLMVSATAWLDNRGWLWTSRDQRVHRLLITPTSVLYAHGDPWPAGAPPRRTLRQYGFVATRSDRLVYRDEVHTYVYSPGSGAKRIVERITLISLRNILLLLLVLPLIHAAFRLRRRRGEQRKLAGLGRCPACHYDLRATSGNCPECGMAPPASQAAKLTSWLVPGRIVAPAQRNSSPVAAEGT